VYTRAAPRNRRSSAFVNRSLLKSKFRFIRMFSVVRQCTLCTYSTLRLYALYSCLPNFISPHSAASRNASERTKHEIENLKMHYEQCRAPVPCIQYCL
jgi:hypothetical protein